MHRTYNRVCFPGRSRHDSQRCVLDPVLTVWTPRVSTQSPARDWHGSTGKRLRRHSVVSWDTLIFSFGAKWPREAKIPDSSMLRKAKVWGHSLVLPPWKWRHILLRFIWCDDVTRTWLILEIATFWCLFHAIRDPSKFKYVPDCSMTKKIWRQSP